jgi:predicted amidohydrolase YtcJ
MGVGRIPRRFGAQQSRTTTGEGEFIMANEKTRLSRRNLLKAAAGVAAAVGAPLSAAAPGKDRNDGNGDGRKGDLVFVNGKIHTMDDAGTVASAVRIRDGRFVSVGRDAAHGPEAREIDLRGRTVVPGLLESHTHFVSLANRPGYHVAGLELATNLAEVLEMLAARRRDVPPGQFITSMGGWLVRQWTENRLPTLAELDSAVPDRPIYLMAGGSGPGVTNTLGKAFFESVSTPLAGPVLVGADGSIINTGGVNHATRALYHLRVLQTFDDKRRSALDAMAYTARVGLTTCLDQVLPPSPGPLTPTQALSGLDHYRMYDAWLSLHREGKAYTRLQTNFLHNQGFIAALGPDLANQLPELRERLRNSFPFFGDDMMKTGWIGEWAAPFVASTSTNQDGYRVWLEAQRLVAQAGWRNENSQSTVANIEQVVSTYEAMDAEFGIKDLRWGLQHAEIATPTQLARLKALNCGVSMSGFRWTGEPRADGLPHVLFRQIVESGINAGMHEDGVHIAPHNPWFALHFATTGLNYRGVDTNSAQKITRQQALHCYTRGNAWYANREDELGSIEEGKLADLVVLDKDYFTVPDAQMRAIKPILSVVAGKVVHDTGALRGRRDWDHDHDHCHDNDQHHRGHGNGRR